MAEEIKYLLNKLSSCPNTNRLYKATSQRVMEVRNVFSPSGGFLVGVGADGTGESSWLAGHQDPDRETTIGTWRLLSGTVLLAFGHVLSSL